MPWGQTTKQDILNLNIGTLEAQKINLAAPLEAKGGTVNLISGSGLGVTSGSLQVRVGTPLRISAGSLGFPTGQGVGQSGGSVVVRTVGAIRLSSGSVGIGLAAGGPLRVVGGSVVVRTAGAVRVSAGSLGVAVGAGVGLNAGGSVVPRVSNPIRVSSGSMGVAVGAGVGLNAGGSVVPRVSNPIRVSSGSMGVAVGAGVGLNAGGSVVVRTVGAIRLSSGSVGIGLAAAGPLRDVGGSVVVRIGAGLQISGGSLNTTGVLAGTAKAQNIGSFAVGIPGMVELKTWTLPDHSFWEGWLDKKRTSRGVTITGAGHSQDFVHEYGGLGYGSLSWTIGNRGTISFPGPGTAYYIGSTASDYIRARGTNSRWFVLDMRATPNVGTVLWQFAGSEGITTGFGAYLRCLMDRTNFVVGERKSNANTNVISGTWNFATGARRLVAIHQQIPSGTFQVLLDQGVNAGMKVLGRFNSVQAGTQPGNFAIRLTTALPASVVIHRMFMAGGGR